MIGTMRKKIGLYGTTVYVLMIWTIFQEFALGIMYHFIHVQSIIKIIFFSKDVLLVVLYIIALIKTKQPRTLLILQILYLPLVVIGTLTSLMTNQVSVMTAISSTRGLVLLPAFLMIGYSIKQTDGFISLIRKKYMRLLVIVAAVGILEYLLDTVVGTRRLWTDFVEIGTYMEDIKGAGNVVSSNGLPGNFYTYAADGSYTQKRLVSFWAHPLTSGYVLILPFFFYFTSLLFGKEKKAKLYKKNLLSFLIITIALFLTFTRGTILPTIMIVIFCLLYRYRTDGGRFFLYVSGLLLAGFVGLVIYGDKIFGYLYNGSTSAHIISLSLAIKEIGLLGRGTGTFAAATSEGVWTESTYVSVAGQLGIAAAIVFIILFLWPIIRVLKGHKKNIICISVALSGLVFFMTGLISEQLCAYTAIAPYYILMGVALRSAIKRNYIFTKLQLAYEVVQ